MLVEARSVGVRSKLFNINKQSTAGRVSNVKQWQLRFRKLGTAGAYVLSYHHRKPRWEELAAGLRACGDGLRVASCREAATTLERDVSVSLYVVHVQRHRPRAFLKPKRSNLNLIRSSSWQSVFLCMFTVPLASCDRRIKKRYT